MSRDESATRPILRDTDDPNNDNELDLQSDCFGASAWCDPRSTLHRFLALILMCLLGFGKLLHSETSEIIERY